MVRLPGIRSAPGKYSATWRRVAPALVIAAACAAAAAPEAGGQIQYLRGQNIAPSFDGWMPNPDGTIELLFGYLNRNFEEHLYIPVGPNNMLEPGRPDQGQPTYFFPRRNMHVFRVTVPRDFGKKELVWTITSNGKTERAYASLKPEFILDARGIYRQYTGFDVQGQVVYVSPNQDPTAALESLAAFAEISRAAWFRAHE